jgi:hypothetical protein
LAIFQAAADRLADRGNNRLCGDTEGLHPRRCAALPWGTTMLVFASASSLYAPRTAFFAALAYLFAIAVSASSLLISTDVPLLVCWVAGLWAFLHYTRTPSRNWPSVSAGYRDRPQRQIRDDLLPALRAGLSRLHARCAPLAQTRRPLAWYRCRHARVPAQPHLEHPARVHHLQPHRREHFRRRAHV